MRRVRVSALGAAGDRVVLGAGEAHHLEVVLRLARGASLVAFCDGWEADAKLADHGVLLVTGDPRRIPALPPLHLVFALPKGQPLDNLLRMSVEVGVTHLHPVISDRTVPRGDHRERWERIVVGAAEQCGRAEVPVVAPLRTLAEGAAAVGPVHRFVGVAGAELPPAVTGAAAWLVGPEGGLAARELDELVDGGWRPAGVGPYVMRVDTAAAVGLAFIRAPGTRPPEDQGAG